MAVSNVSVSPVDPTDAVNQAIQAAEKDEAAFAAQKAELVSALTAMMDALKDGKDVNRGFKALQIAQEQVLPASQACEDDKLTAVADELNISSSVRGCNVALQDIINEGGNITKGDADNFAKWTNELWGQLNDPKVAQFLSPASLDALKSGVLSIYTQFGCTKDGNLDPTQPLTGDRVLYDMQQWFKPLDPKKPPQPPAAAVSALQNAFQQINVTVTSLSQTQQTILQSDVNDDNQIIGTNKEIFSSSEKLGMLITNNFNK